MPSLLIDIGANIARLQTDMEQAQKTVSRFAKGIERDFSSLKGILAGAGLTMGAGQMITAFMDSERAAMKMAVAMKNQGDYTKAALADMEAYAAQIQRTTAFEDDATLAIMANLKTYGMTNEEVKKTTQAVLDLASAKQDEGMTTERASELIGKAYMGETQALKRVGIVIDENIPKTEAYAKVMDQIQQRFGGAAAAELETYAGQWKQLKNEFSDIAEVIGQVLLKAMEGAWYGANKIAQGFYLTEEALSSFWSKVTGFLGLDTISGALKDASAEFGSFAKLAEDRAETMAQAFSKWGESVDKAVGKMKDGTKTVVDKTDWKAVTQTLQQYHKYLSEVVSVSSDFEKEKIKLGKSTQDAELAELNVRYQNYKKFVTDEVALEQWMADEKKAIMIRANNEEIALLEELFKATANEKYRVAALDLMKEIQDAEQEKWKLILKNDDDAYLLREIRDKAYSDKLEEMIKGRVEIEKKGVDEAASYASGFFFKQYGNQDTTMAGGAGMGTGISGAPLLPVPGWIAPFPHGGVPLARGGILDRGELTAFARGGIVDRPTVFPMARGMGLMGEAGPEAVMPLSRGRDGRLGVAGGGNVTIAPGAIVINGIRSPKETARAVMAEIRKLQARVN